MPQKKQASDSDYWEYDCVKAGKYGMIAAYFKNRKEGSTILDAPELKGTWAENQMQPIELGYHVPMDSATRLLQIFEAANFEGSELQKAINNIRCIAQIFLDGTLERNRDYIIGSSCNVDVPAVLREHNIYT